MLRGKVLEDASRDGEKVTLHRALRRLIVPNHHKGDRRRRSQIWGDGVLTAPTETGCGCP